MRLFLTTLLFACSPDPDPKPVDDEDTGGPILDIDACATLDLPVRPFEHVEDDKSMYATAADFTVSLIDGTTWTLSEEWTGCDTYLVIQDTPSQTQGWPIGLWDRDVDTFMDRLPANVHVFFVSDQADAGARTSNLSGLKESVDAVISGMNEEDAAWWSDRFHYISSRSIDMDGWLGDIMLSPRFPIGIDRLQRIRYVGSFADYERYSSSAGWFEPNLSMAANEIVYYNFEAEREARLAAQDATIVTIFDGSEYSDSGWSGRRGTIDVELPDAATMAGFDTLEYDLYLGCVGEGEYGTCPAWDYLVYLYQCDIETAENTHTEEACQPYIAPVTAVEEVMGHCVEDAGDTGAPETDGTKSGDTGTPEASDDTGSGGTDPGTTDSGTTDSGTTDTGAPTGPPCMTDEDCAEYEHCEGYVAPVEEVIEVIADTLECSCEEPDGTTYDTTQTCNGEGTGYNDCACDCGDEIGRWITTYHREGRWVHDASALLPKIRPGGKQRFSFYTQQAYEVHLDFRLMNSGKDTNPQETLTLFSGGGFGENYNDRDAMEVDIPASATKVELAYVVSGHGQSDPGNCAEFCVTTHHFFVNGTEHEVALSDAGSAQGCMDQVSEGTVPNQYGTWWYGRSNWCPGKEVEVDTIDITADVNIGETNTFRYEGYYNGSPYTAGGARIELKSWIAVSE